MSTTWEERERWIQDHGMGHGWAAAIGTITDADSGTIRSVYSCSECGALVVERHTHADWHLKAK